MEQDDYYFLPRDTVITTQHPSPQTSHFSLYCYLNFNISKFFTFKSNFPFVPALYKCLLSTESMIDALPHMADTVLKRYLLQEAHISTGEETQSMIKRNSYSQKVTEGMIRKVLRGNI